MEAIERSSCGETRAWWSCSSGPIGAASSCYVALALAILQRIELCSGTQRSDSVKDTDTQSSLKSEPPFNYPYTVCYTVTF